MPKRSYVKGGSKRRMATGYIAVWRPSHPLAMRTGYVYEHRMVAWDAGLLTNPAHEVHHANEIRDDNRLENLVVMESSSQHLRAHHLAVGQTVRNQHGAWVVGTGITRRAEEAKAALGPRFCEGCGVPLSPDRRLGTLYCTPGCRIRAWKRAHRQHALDAAQGPQPR